MTAFVVLCGSYDSTTTIRGASPFSMVIALSGNVYSFPVYRCVPLHQFAARLFCSRLLRRVWNDTLLQTENITPSPLPFGTVSPVQFTLGTPRGTGALAFGDVTQETNLPASGSREQLVVRCVDNTNLLDDSCKFAKELKAGYLLVIDNSTQSNFSSRLPVTRVITSIISDTELTVDADFNQGLYLGSDFLDTNLPHSGTKGTPGFPIAGVGEWTFVACPPRVGKRANGVGTIESSWNQATWSNSLLDSTDVSKNTGDLTTASGGATGLQHRIVGRGTRFATQFGQAWASFGSGGYYGLGPYISVQVRALAYSAATKAC
jgi:hypothetical protein